MFTARNISLVLSSLARKQVKDVVASGSARESWWHHRIEQIERVFSIVWPGVSFFDICCLNMNCGGVAVIMEEIHRTPMTYRNIGEAALACRFN